MADQVTDVLSWQPANVVPVTGALKLAGTGVTSTVNLLNGIIQTGVVVAKAAALLVPATLDPAVIALNTSITAAQKLLRDFTIPDGDLSVLLVPPIVGSKTDVLRYIERKLDDPSDPFRPAPATDTTRFHAGYILFATARTPQGVMDAYKASVNLFGALKKFPSNSTGFRGFRPAVKVAVVGGNPLVSWTNPHPLDLGRGAIRIKDAQGNTYNTVKGIQQVVVWRRKRGGGGNITEEKISTFSYNPFVSSYVDTDTKEGTWDYAVEFDLVLNNDLTVAMKSNWVKVNVTKKLKKKAVGGGNYPQFMGVKAAYTVEGLDTAIGRVDQWLEQFKRRSTTFKNEANQVADFLSNYANNLTNQINNLVNQITRVASNLDVLAKSGLSFAAYEGHPRACLSQILSQDPGSSTDLNIAVFLNASSNNQTLANLAVDGIKKLCGWGGEFRLVDGLSQQAQAIRNAGVTIFEDFTKFEDTTVSSLEDTFTGIQDNISQLDALSKATLPSE